MSNTATILLGIGVIIISILIFILLHTEFFRFSLGNNKKDKDKEQEIIIKLNKEYKINVDNNHRASEKLKILELQVDNDKKVMKISPNVEAHNVDNVMVQTKQDLLINNSGPKDFKKHRIKARKYQQIEDYITDEAGIRMN